MNRIARLGRRHASMAVAAVLLLWLGGVPATRAASCTGASHDLTLSNGRVTPATGTTATSFTFAVDYRDTAGCAPSVVTVTIVGVGTMDLGATGTAYETGVTFRRELTLPAGTRAYSFHAENGTGNAGQRSVTLSAVSPAVVTVTEPTPEPTLEPTPEPTLDPTATPRPAPSPPPTPPPSPPPIPSPTPALTPTPTAVPTGTPTASSGATGGGPGPTSNGGQTDGAANQPGPAVGPPDKDRGSSTLASGIGVVVEPAGALAQSGGLADLASGGPAWILVASGVAAIGGSGLFAALMLLLPVRRSRIVASAGQISAPAVVAYPEDRALGEALVDPETPPEEAHIPRWRRPSLRAARQRSAYSAPIERVPLRFGAPADSTAERRSVRYRFVKLATQPDEILGDEVARLDRGDEVEILSEEHGFVRVRTPDGLDGWVPRMTLGPIGSERSDPD